MLYGVLRLIFLYCYKEISVQTLKICASSSTSKLYFVWKKLTAQQEKSLYLCHIDLQKNTKTAAYVYGTTNHSQNVED